jgi:tetratricopeptide (TPR) repeat protein
MVVVFLHHGNMSKRWPVILPVALGVILASLQVGSCKGGQKAPPDEKKEPAAAEPPAPVERKEEKPGKKELSAYEKEWAAAVESPLACAMYLTTRMKYEDERVEAFLDISEKLEGEKQAEVLGKALDQIDGLDDMNQALDVLERIAWAHIEAGRKSEAKEVMAEIKELAGELDQVRYTELYALALSGLAGMQVGIGGKGKKLVEEVSELVGPAMIDLDDRSEIVSRCAEAGEHDTALELASDVWDAMDDEVDHVLAGLAVSCAGRGEIDRALEIGEKLGTSVEKARVMESVSFALLEGKRDEEALEVLEKAVTALGKVGYEEYSAKPLARVARLFIEVGRKERALDVIAVALEQAKRIEDFVEYPGYGDCVGYPEPIEYEMDGDLPRTRALVEVARGYREAGDAEAAVEVLDLALVESKGIEEEQDRYLCRMSIVNEYIELGMLNWARSAAKRIKDGPMRAEAHVRIAVAYEKKGKKKSAAELFDENIPLLDRQSAGEIALELEMEGCRERALQVARRVDSLTKAIDVLPLVLRLEPFEGPAKGANLELLQGIVGIVK